MKKTLQKQSFAARGRCKCVASHAKFVECRRVNGDRTGFSQLEFDQAGIVEYKSGA